MIFFMALTEELPIYRATYRLLNLLIRATQDFPRYYKYSLGTRMVDVCLDMSMLLYKANSSYEKVELIKEFLSKFSILQMLLRVCAEQKVIDTKKVAVFALEMEKIGKQATGWKQFPREILLCFIIGNGGLYHKNERKNKIG